MNTTLTQNQTVRLQTKIEKARSEKKRYTSGEVKKILGI
jgi:hypothetical protein